MHKGPHLLCRTQCWTIFRYQTTSSYNSSDLFISIDRITFLSPTLDNAYPHFALVITPCFYLHQVEVVDEDPASGCLNNGFICYNFRRNIPSRYQTCDELFSVAQTCWNDVITESILVAQ